jgi:hypothetical protein
MLLDGPGNGFLQSCGLKSLVSDDRLRFDGDPFVFATMTLKIERIAGEHTTVIRLIGRLRREHLSIVTKQIQSSTGAVTLDLAELTLISVEGVRFLNNCEDQGIAVANASPYVTDWMKREKTPTDESPC